MFFKVNVNNPTKHKVYSQSGAHWIIVEPYGPLTVGLHDCSFDQWKEYTGEPIKFDSLTDEFVENGCVMSIYKV